MSDELAVARDETTHICVVCYAEADTCVAFRGSQGYCIGALITLGVPTDEAVDTFLSFVKENSVVPFPAPGRYGLGARVLDEDPELWYQMTYVVCRSCNDKSGCDFLLSNTDRTGELVCYFERPE